MATESNSPEPKTPALPHQPPASESVTKTRVKEALARVPSVSEGEWRIACSDIAEELSKHTAFRFRIMWPIAAALVTILGALIAYYGISTKKEIDAQLETIKADATTEIGTARAAVTAQVVAQFKDENIKAIVEKAAAMQSANLLSASVQPSIDLFNKRIEERLAAFDASLIAQKESATKDLEALRTELARLKLRNEITALADRAVGEGDVASYRKLEEMGRSQEPNQQNHAVVAELFRVYHAYSIFAPTRSHSVQILVGAVNPNKTKEEELDYAELVGIWEKVTDGFARAKVASLLAEKVKFGSFKEAQWTLSAIQKETNLEAMNKLRGVFQRITNYDKGGRLDNADILEWWEKNSDDFQKNDTDKTSVAPNKP